MARGVYPKFTDDHGVPEIRIGVRAFKCIGASPPQDHPHIYLAMGGQDPSILCLPLLRDPISVRLRPRSIRGRSARQRFRIG